MRSQRLEKMANNSSVIILDPYYTQVSTWTAHAMAIFISVSLILGLQGNCLVVAVHRKIKVKTVTDWMIFYIAVCDIFTLINLPLYILQFEKIWSSGFPNFLCKIHYFSCNSIAMASYVWCSCTALERYQKVARSKEALTITQAKYIWIPVFFVCFGLGTVSIFAVNNNENGHCMYDMKVRYLSTIQYVIMLFVATLTSIVMISCYVRMGVFLLKKIRETKYTKSTSFSKSHRGTIKLTKMLAIVTVVFLFSANFPYIVGVTFTSKRPDTEPIMSIMFSVTGSSVINNFINPFLYLAMSRIFRKRTRELFRICCG